MGRELYEHDVLTGLPNRRALLVRMADTEAGWRSLAYVDLDGFKGVNDVYGHGQGDSALRGCAELLRSGLPSSCELFRIGGDEFAVLSRVSPEALADVLAVLNERVPEVDGLGLTFSAGVVRVENGVVTQQHLHESDVAMYTAKRKGRGLIEPYGEDAERFRHDRRDLLERLERLHEDNRRLLEQALTDDLTKLGNRRALDRRMKHADALRAAGDGVAVLFADIDDFGLYNRLHGDSAGDEVLTVVAEAMQLCLREHDVFRKGGEEFVALLVDVGHGHAAAIAERLRVAVEDLAIPHGGPGRPVVTVTIGVALADDATSVEEARNLAGRRAYWLKVNNRRNQVLAEGPPPADWTPDEDPPEDDAA